MLRQMKTRSVTRSSDPYSRGAKGLGGRDMGGIGMRAPVLATNPSRVGRPRPAAAQSSGFRNGSVTLEAGFG